MLDQTSDSDVAWVGTDPINATIVQEGGKPDTYTVVIENDPGQTVEVKVVPEEDAATQFIAAPIDLTFTLANWDKPQTVTVTAIDDLIAEPQNQFFNITHEVTIGVPGSAPGLLVEVVDNDVAKLIAPNDTIKCDEGKTITYDVQLNSEPTKNVRVAVHYSTRDVNTGVPSIGRDFVLTFSSSTWFKPQQVRISPPRDFVDWSDYGETDFSYFWIWHTTDSSDPFYEANTAGVNNVTVEIRNVDHAGLKYKSPIVIMEGDPHGGTLAIELASRPLADVWLMVYERKIEGGYRADGLAPEPLDIVMWQDVPFDTDHPTVSPTKAPPELNATANTTSPTHAPTMTPKGFETFLDMLVELRLNETHIPNATANFLEYANKDGRKGGGASEEELNELFLSWGMPEVFKPSAPQVASFIYHRADRDGTGDISLEELDGFWDPPTHAPTAPPGHVEILFPVKRWNMTHYLNISMPDDQFYGMPHQTTHVIFNVSSKDYVYNNVDEIECGFVAQASRFEEDALAIAGVDLGGEGVITVNTPAPTSCVDHEKKMELRVTEDDKVAIHLKYTPPKEGDEDEDEEEAGEGVGATGKEGAQAALLTSRVASAADPNEPITIILREGGPAAPLRFTFASQPLRNVTVLMENDCTVVHHDKEGPNVGRVQQKLEINGEAKALHVLHFNTTTELSVRDANLKSGRAPMQMPHYQVIMLQATQNGDFEGNDFWCQINLTAYSVDPNHDSGTTRFLPLFKPQPRIKVRLEDDDSGLLDPSACERIGHVLSVLLVVVLALTALDVGARKSDLFWILLHHIQFTALSGKLTGVARNSRSYRRIADVLDWSNLWLPIPGEWSRLFEQPSPRHVGGPKDGRALRFLTSNERRWAWFHENLVWGAICLPSVLFVFCVGRHLVLRHVVRVAIEKQQKAEQLEWARVKKKKAGKLRYKETMEMKAMFERQMIAVEVKRRADFYNLHSLEEFFLGAVLVGFQGLAASAACALDTAGEVTMALCAFVLSCCFLFIVLMAWFLRRGVIAPPPIKCTKRAWRQRFWHIVRFVGACCIKTFRCVRAVATGGRAADHLVDMGGGAGGGKVGAAAMDEVSDAAQKTEAQVAEEEENARLEQMARLEEERQKAKLEAAKRKREADLAEKRRKFNPRSAFSKFVKPDPTQIVHDGLLDHFDPHDKRAVRGLMEHVAQLGIWEVQEPRQTSSSGSETARVHRFYHRYRLFFRPFVYKEERSRWNPDFHGCNTGVFLHALQQWFGAHMSVLVGLLKMFLFALILGLLGDQRIVARYTQHHGDARDGVDGGGAFVNSGGIVVHLVDVPDLIPPWREGEGETAEWRSATDTAFEYVI